MALYVLLVDIRPYKVPRFPSYTITYLDSTELLS